MKIVIDRKSFVDALAIGSQMAGKARGLSILENCKLTIKGNMATISSYDSEVAITKRTTIVSSDEDFVLCIDPRDLLAILRSLKDENVTLEFENCICEIIHTRGKQSMPYDGADDFPVPVLDKESKAFNIESSVMFGWLSEARNFVGSNTLYPAMMGVYVYCGNNECGVASTNMEILYHNNQTIDVDCDEFGASLSIKAIGALLPMLNSSIGVEVMIGSRNIVFKTTDAMLVATRTENPYPNFRRIIPKNQPIEVTASKEEFLDAVKRAMLMANEKTQLLKLKVTPLCVSITSDNPMFAKKAYEECFCTCNGTDVEISLKGSYVMSMINSIESDEVKFTIETPQRPILWCDSMNSAKVLLQMPMQG